jgi:hypothetical protein
MTVFTIDEQNNITAFATQEEAAAATSTPFDSFSNPQELAELAKAWPAERLVAIWNSLPGVTPTKRFKDANGAVTRIWERIQKLGTPEGPKADDAAPAAAQAEKPKAQRKAKGGAQSAKGTPAKGKATQKATAVKNAPKAKKAAKEPKAKVARKAKESAEPKAVRTGTKSAEVIAMLRRKGGATLGEIMAHTGWQKHTTRGWVSGFLGKKMGIAVESFKSDNGERTYRINQ